MTAKTASRPRVPTQAEAVKFRGEISNLSEAIGAALRKAGKGPNGDDVSEPDSAPRDST